ncbi:MAG: hypothetical protein GDA48_16870 [Hormoscilla sp. GM102CHS1]|nr:hypothetical protein [Hormoscilla sp. GM102CHS1]
MGPKTIGFFAHGHARQAGQVLRKKAIGVAFAVYKMIKSIQRSLLTEETTLTASYTQAELFIEPGRVARLRATALQEALSPPSRTRVTMAAAVVEDSQENRRVIIKTSEPNGYLRPGVKSALQPGESVVPGYGHAEANIVVWATKNDDRVIAVAAGRPICENCVGAIEDAGALVASPKKFQPRS